jgi:hypothetical protein
MTLNEQPLLTARATGRINESVRELWRVFRAAPLEPLLWLLAGDLVLIGLHLAYAESSKSMLSIERDKGYAESFQYLKELWIVLTLLWMALRPAGRLHAVIAGVFCYLLIDDAFSIHEKYGRKLASYLGVGPMFRLRGQDFGEFAIFAVVGLVSLAAIGLAFRLGSARFRLEAAFLVAALGALAFFGVVMDMLHVMFKDGMLNQPLGLVEDGGEMLVMSFICWSVLAFSLARRQDGRA